MRKELVPGTSPNAVQDNGSWLDLETIARVEVTSEDPAHPIESALVPGRGDGWRAAQPGLQTIRILFDSPRHLGTIQIVMEERERHRSQEFVLRWSQDRGKGYREVVRQQFNFNPPGTVTEREEYRVELPGVTVLELEIIPDREGSDGRASLVSMRLA